MPKFSGAFLFFAVCLAGWALPDDALYTALLESHVDQQGQVDYAALKSDPRLDAYLATVAATDPARLDGNERRLAFWLNAYNAYTLKLIVDNYPLASINLLATAEKYADQRVGKTPWDIKFAAIHGERVTLNHIEHEVIRKQFEEPRVHFALVCAAKSCPPLRREAYMAARLDEQLTEQAEIFLNDPSKNRFNGPLRRAEVSRVFDWFKDDFGTSDAAVLAYVADFLPGRSGRSIARAPESWQLDYTDYDWALNAQP